MNWTRGLLRLWALLAVCWAASIIFLYSNELLAVKAVGRTSLAASCVDAPPKIPMKLSEIEGKTFECEFQGQKFRIGGMGAAATSDDALSIFYRDHSELFMIFVSDWPTRIAAIGWVIFPPALSLLLGLAGIWVARGFRAVPPTS